MSYFMRPFLAEIQEKNEISAKLRLWVKKFKKKAISDSYEKFWADWMKQWMMNRQQ